MDDPRLIAYDAAAPAPERFDAQAQLSEIYRPLASELIPGDNVRAVIDYITSDLQEQEMAKARSGGVIRLDDYRNKDKKRGIGSVFLDDLQIFAMGEYWEKPTPLGFEGMRVMVEQTPVLNAILLTRIRQVCAFARVQEERGPGFEIRHKDRKHILTSEEEQSTRLLATFFENCGWETDARARKRLRRDTFQQFMAKLVRDSLTMDAAAIETEYKRDRRLGLDGMYAVDGATIRLCSEHGYQGDEEIFAVQVIQGRVRTLYGYDDLIYEPRNPRSDVRLTGYGMSETELLVRVVTGWLNALTYNIKGFDSNAIPRGLLHLTGNYSQEDLTAFKRYWNAMVKGVNNAWSLPVLVSKDQESKAAFENFNIEYNEMYFSKWMTFLTSICCAIYGMSPDEINFESFSAGRSALSGSDTAEKLADSKDKGLRPLLAYFEGIFTDFICAPFSDKYVFRWVGLDQEDEQRRHDMRKMVLTVNEVRAEEGYKKSEAFWGDAPLNPSLIGPWMQDWQSSQQDFGQPPDGMGADREGDFGGPGGDVQAPDDRQDEDRSPTKDESMDESVEARFGKSYIYTI